ncbi:MAG: TolC family protein [bacterium]
MCRRWGLVILIGIICFGSNASAITWKEAVGLAEKNNFEIKSAVKQVESYDWSLKKSYSTFLPQLSASSSIATGSTGASYSFSATQNIFKGMDDFYGVDAAAVDLAYQKANLAATKANVLYDVRSAFVGLLIAQENIKLLEAILAQRSDDAELIQLLYDSGKEDKGNLMQTRAEEAKARYDLLSARRDMRLAQAKITNLLISEVNIADAPMSFSKPEQTDVDKLVKETPAYTMAELTLKSADIASSRTISGFLPDLSLRGSYGNSGAGSAASSSLSLNLSYNFYPGGSNFADSGIYETRLAKAKEDYAKSLQDIGYSIEEARENYLNVLDLLDVGKLSMAAAGERAQIAKSKYLNGLMSYDEWVRIENDHVSARKQMLSFQRSAFLAEALMYKTNGGWVR